MVVFQTSTNDLTRCFWSRGKCNSTRQWYCFLN